MLYNSILNSTINIFLTINNINFCSIDSEALRKYRSKSNPVKRIKALFLMISKRIRSSLPLQTNNSI